MGSTLRIVILQRGWVVVGMYEEDGMEVVVTNARVIRRWGTSEGIAELAHSGPLPETKLDMAGTVRTYRTGVLFTIDCNADAWKHEYGE